MTILFYFYSSTFLVSTLYFTSSSFLSVTKLVLDFNFPVLFTPLINVNKQTSLWGNKRNFYKHYWITFSLSVLKL